MKKKLYKSATFLFAILSISNSCTKSTAYDTPGTGPGPGPKGGPGINEVWIQDMAFSPSTITVTEGTTIKWTNKDTAPHTVTGDTPSFDSGTIASDGTFSNNFSIA